MKTVVLVPPDQLPFALVALAAHVENVALPVVTEFVVRDDRGGSGGYEIELPVASIGRAMAIFYNRFLAKEVP